MVLFQVEMEVSGVSKIFNRYLNTLYRSQSFSVSFLELSAHFSWEAKVFPNKAFTSFKTH